MTGGPRAGEHLPEMPFFLRTITTPPLNQIVAVPQIVIIDQTGPAIVLGTQQGASCMVGEFVAGPFTPLEVDSSADVQGIYSATGTIYPYFSQDASTPPIQNGTQKAYNGNGLLQLLGQIFQRLSSSASTTRRSRRTAGRRRASSR